CPPASHPVARRYRRTALRPLFPPLAAARGTGLRPRRAAPGLAGPGPCHARGGPYARCPPPMTGQTVLTGSLHRTHLQHVPGGCAGPAPVGFPTPDDLHAQASPSGRVMYDRNRDGFAPVGRRSTLRPVAVRRLVRRRGGAGACPGAGRQFGQAPAVELSGWTSAG